MAAKMMQVEIWVLVNEGEEYAISRIEEDLVGNFENDVGPIGDAGTTRRVKVVLSIPIPETVTLTGDVPAEGEATLSVS